MKKIKKFGHQGDLNFRKIKSLPDGVIEKTKIDKQRGGITLALGGHSGHAHTLIKEKGVKFKVWEDEEGKQYIEVLRGVARLVHGTFIAPGRINEKEVDKHDVIWFEPGIYKQDFETGYDPFLQQAIQVVD